MKTISMKELFGVSTTEELGAIALIGVEEMTIHDDDTISVTIQADKIHMNMHDSVQGGMQYLICDTTIGAYFKYKGLNGVGVEGSIHYFRPGKEGDTLTATLMPRKVGRKTGNFLIQLTNQDNKLVAEAYYTTMFNPYE